MLIPKNRPSHRFEDLLRFPSFNEETVRVWETTFAHAMGAPHGIAFPHARVAMSTALRALLPGPATVLMPAYSCVVVAHAIVLAGHRPRFVDIEPQNFNVKPHTYIEQLDDTVEAIIPTHMYGTPTDLRALEQSVTRPLYFLEDGALGLHPAFAPQNPLVQSCTVYSFGSNKILSTIHGGMIVTHSAELAERIRAVRDATLFAPTLRLLAMQYLELTALIVLFSPTLYGMLDRLRSSSLFAGHLDTRSLDEPAFPSNSIYTYSSFQAALGQSQQQKQKVFLERRRYLATEYTNALKDIPGILPMHIHPQSHFSHYALRIPNRDKKNIPQRFHRFGIEVGHTFNYALPNLAAYRQYASNPFPHAVQAAEETINLPNYPALSEQGWEYIVQTTRSVLASV